MTRHAQLHVILASAIALAACGGSDSVNNTQSTQAEGAPLAAGQAAPLAEGSGPAAVTGSAARTTAPASSTSPSAGSAAPQAPAPASPIPEFREINVPSGTRLPLEMLTAVSSETSTVESAVRARLTRDVIVDGIVAIPSGVILTGVVTEAERAGRVKGLSRLAFRFTSAEVRGTTERMRTDAVVLVGEESTKGDAARIGGGAVAGAVIGGLLGGGKGAAQGAAIGGGAGTGVVLATRGKDVELASGASVTATLAAPLTLQIPR